MKIKGADILINCLIEQGVDTVFGYPGGQVIDIYDALYRSGKINHVLTAHEQGASHAADGYARASGKTGVVIATSGPGATNIVTGIATAHMDSIPLVAITGNVVAANLGRDSFQEVDITGVTIPITKHNYIVKDITKLADTVREAFYIANSGRKGPVLIDIPKNVQNELTEYEPKERECYSAKGIAKEKLTAVADILKTAKKPLLVLGGGIIGADAGNAAAAFAEKYDCPVAFTLMGLGAIPTDNPRALGMIGMHGTFAAAKAYSESDTLITVGMRFSDRVAQNRASFGKNKTIIHVDIDTAEINKNIPAAYSILGDCKSFFEEITPLIESGKHDAWHAEIEGYKKRERPNCNIMAYKILKAARKKLPQENPVATDVGQHQMWTALHFDILRPRTLITSGGLGTMGFGLGAAIGAAMATGKQTLLVTGDGSFHMNFNELCTAVTQKLPIVILLMNNNALGMVRQWQTLFYDRRYSQTTLNRVTDYVKLAEAMGATGMTISSESEIDRVLDAAFALKTTVVVDCKIGLDDCVLPMIPPGKNFDDIIVEIDN